MTADTRPCKGDAYVPYHSGLKACVDCTQDQFRGGKCLAEYGWRWASKAIPVAAAGIELKGAK